MIEDPSNPAPRAGGASPDDARVSWFDIATAAESERGRHAIWRDELRRRLDTETLTEIERDTMRRAIRARARDVAVFEAMSRLIDRVRGDGYILHRLREIDAVERATADVAPDAIAADEWTQGFVSYDTNQEGAR